MIVPFVNDNGSRSDLYSRLLEDRIIFLCGEIGMDESCAICAQMLFLESKDSEKDISFYMNSPGGSVSAALAIYDVMQFIKCDVSTVCIGQCASAASLLLSAGKKGKRYSLPHSTIMVHQPLAYGLGGQATDLAIRIDHINKQKNLIERIYVETTGMNAEKVSALLDRDTYIDASTAKEYGLIDSVVVNNNM
ncbi:ATP-dependent Clp protease proteolytic subunit [Candidatus Gromoviella agglomerans]|nr:ATP-dependent Clp protease proteolytic subunit [Candidatus Gromoviella agglomerans]UFX98255.1 ATP-dependent Clp protease proteolytic subunit [Candidatus Gromoviella agglomerans]